MPDTGAYDAMLDRQIRAMESAQNGAVKQKQAELDAALRAQTNAMRDLKDARIERANEVASVEAEARRLSNIIGTPGRAHRASASDWPQPRCKSQRPSGQAGAAYCQNDCHLTWRRHWFEHHLRF